MGLWEGCPQVAGRKGFWGMRGAGWGLEPEVTGATESGLGKFIWERRPRLARGLQTDVTLALRPVIYIMKKIRACTIIQKSVFPNRLAACRARPRPARPRQPRQLAPQLRPEKATLPALAPPPLPSKLRRYHPADPSEQPERYRPQPLIGRRRGGVASGAWFCAPEPARRIASRARSGRHGEEWLWGAGGEGRGLGLGSDQSQGRSLPWERGQVNAGTALTLAP